MEIDFLPILRSMQSVFALHQFFNSRENGDS